MTQDAKPLKAGQLDDRFLFISSPETRIATIATDRLRTEFLQCDALPKDMKQQIAPSLPELVLSFADAEDEEKDNPSDEKSGGTKPGDKAPPANDNLSSKDTTVDIKLPDLTRQVRVGNYTLTDNAPLLVTASGAILPKGSGKPGIAELRQTASGDIILVPNNPRATAYIRGVDGNIRRLQPDKKTGGIEVRPGEAFTFGYPSFTELSQVDASNLVVNLVTKDNKPAGSFSLELNDTVEVGKPNGEVDIKSGATARVNLADGVVSREQATFGFDKGGLYVQDGTKSFDFQPSANGTWVDGVKLNPGEKKYLSEKSVVVFSGGDQATSTRAVIDTKPGTDGTVTIARDLPNRAPNKVLVMKPLGGSGGSIELAADQTIWLGKKGDINTGGNEDKSATIRIDEKGNAFIRVSPDSKRDVLIQNKSGLTIRLTAANSWYPIESTDKVSVGGLQYFTLAETNAETNKACALGIEINGKPLDLRPGTQIVLGRNPIESKLANKVTVDAPAVSNEHLILGVDDKGRVYVEEILKTEKALAGEEAKKVGARNGTYLNDDKMRLEPGVRTYLKAGDTVSLAPFAVGTKGMQFTVTKAVTQKDANGNISDKGAAAGAKILFAPQSVPIDRPIPSDYKLHSTVMKGPDGTLAQTNNGLIRYFRGNENHIRETIPLTSAEVSNLDSNPNFEKFQFSNSDKTYYRKRAGQGNRFYFLEGNELVRDHSMFIEPARPPAQKEKAGFLPFRETPPPKGASGTASGAESINIVPGNDALGGDKTKEVPKSASPPLPVASTPQGDATAETDSRKAKVARLDALLIELNADPKKMQTAELQKVLETKLRAKLFGFEDAKPLIELVTDIRDADKLAALLKEVQEGRSKQVEAGLNPELLSKDAPKLLPPALANSELGELNWKVLQTLSGPPKFEQLSEIEKAKRSQKAVELLMPVLKQQAELLGLPPELISADSIKFMTLGENQSGAYNIRGDLIKLDVNNPFPVNTAMHELVHRMQWLEIIAASKADPVGFRQAMMKSCVSNIGQTANVLDGTGEMRRRHAFQNPEALKEFKQYVESMMKKTMEKDFGTAAPANVPVSKTLLTEFGSVENLNKFAAYEVENWIVLSELPAQTKLNDAAKTYVKARMVSFSHWAHSTPGANLVRVVVSDMEREGNPKARNSDEIRKRVAEITARDGRTGGGVELSNEFIDKVIREFDAAPVHKLEDERKNFKPGTAGLGATEIEKSVRSIEDNPMLGKLLKTATIDRVGMVQGGEKEYAFSSTEISARKIDAAMRAKRLHKALASGTISESDAGDLKRNFAELMQYMKMCTKQQQLHNAILKNDPKARQIAKDLAAMVTGTVTSTEGNPDTTKAFLNDTNMASKGDANSANGDMIQFLKDSGLLTNDEVKSLELANTSTQPLNFTELEAARLEKVLSRYGLKPNGISTKACLSIIRKELSTLGPDKATDKTVLEYLEQKLGRLPADSKLKDFLGPENASNGNGPQPISPPETVAPGKKPIQGDGVVSAGPDNVFKSSNGTNPEGPNKEAPGGTKSGGTAQNDKNKTASEKPDPKKALELLQKLRGLDVAKGVSRTAAVLTLLGAAAEALTGEDKK